MNKFLVIQTAFIGDAILTLPMIQKLKEMNPGCLIDVISIPETAVIFNHSPAVNEVHIFDKHGKHKSAPQVYRFAKFLKQRGYDRIYAPHRSLRTSLLVMLSGVNETYGFNINSMSHVYKHITDYKADRHEVERNLRLIKYPITDDDWKILPEVNIPPETENKIEGFFGELGQQNNFAAVAPGSVWPTKIYPEEYVKEVIGFLKTRFDKVFLIGGEKDRYICEELAEKISGNVKSVAGNFSLIETISLLKRIKLLISNDSAPAHLAMCADIPVLMLYCS
ncbi:MAG TPA: glycosyltransferase family 9 protein, partial [Ignavibacteriaceae bacterium]